MCVCVCVFSNVGCVCVLFSISPSLSISLHLSQDIADEAWYKYLQRNQSVVVKVFQGQLKSTLVCPQCSKVRERECFENQCFSLSHTLCMSYLSTLRCTHV